jgi:mannose-1-phosphate guanylyltransferase
MAYSFSQMEFCPVILAGGSGTRFWPRSRRSRAKQVLALSGDGTMIQQTVARLLPVASPDHVWVITNHWLADTIREQLPELDDHQILIEPVARNTAPACGLAAFLIERQNPETVMGIFPSDHVVSNERRFAEVIAAGIKIASQGENIVVLGVPPTRPETGYGYIEQGSAILEPGPVPTHRVKRFREKPERHTAEQFLAAGNFSWNGGIFLWKAHTLAEAIREHVPDMAPLLEKIAAAYGTPHFEAVLAEVYPEVESISIDYAILERRSAKGEKRSNIFCIPADFGWNDLGSWDSLHEHLSSDRSDNVVDGPTKGLVALQSTGNYVFVPGKTVALLGVSGLVVVETEDALLITTLKDSQDVSKVVRLVHEGGGEKLI